MKKCKHIHAVAPWTEAWTMKASAGQALLHITTCFFDLTQNLAVCWEGGMRLSSNFTMW